SPGRRNSKPGACHRETGPEIRIRPPAQLSHQNAKEPLAPLADVFPRHVRTRWNVTRKPRDDFEYCTTPFFRLGASSANKHRAEELGQTGLSWPKCTEDSRMSAHAHGRQPHDSQSRKHARR